MIQVELEKRLRNRKDMEAELLSLTASMSDVLHVGHTEAQELTEAVQSTATEAEQVSATGTVAVSVLPTMNVHVRRLHVQQTQCRYLSGCES